MPAVDVQQVIKNHELDVAELAEHLFPSNKHPRLALNRVIKGKGTLNSKQLSKLAALCNISINELYQNNWKQQSKNGLHTFTNNEYKAILDTSTWVTRIFHKNSLFHAEVIHTGDVVLKDYIAKLNELIINHIKTS